VPTKKVKAEKVKAAEANSFFFFKINLVNWGEFIYTLINLKKFKINNNLNLQYPEIFNSTFPDKRIRKKTTHR
jgi:hypothetical protein